MFILILHISIILYYYTIFDNFLSNAFYINFLIIKIFIKRIYFLSHTYVYNFTSTNMYIFLLTGEAARCTTWKTRVNFGETASWPIGRHKSEASGDPSGIVTP